MLFLDHRSRGGGARCCTFIDILLAVRSLGAVVVADTRAVGDAGVDAWATITIEAWAGAWGHGSEAWSGCCKLGKGTAHRNLQCFDGFPSCTQSLDEALEVCGALPMSNSHCMHMWNVEIRSQTGGVDATATIVDYCMWSP